MGRARRMWGILNLLERQSVAKFEQPLEIATNLAIKPEREGHEMTQYPASDVLPARSWSTGTSGKNSRECSLGGVDGDGET